MGILPEIRELWKTLHVNGGVNLGLKSGELKKGYKADFITLNLQSPSLLPAVFEDEIEIPLLNQIVFSMQTPSVLESVYVEGQKVYSQGALTKMDSAEVYNRFKNALK